MTLALVSTVLLGTVDIATGFEISFSIFYLGPVALSTWYAGRREGFLTSAVAAAAWFLADSIAGHSYSSPLIPFWNALVRFGYFTITVYLLTRLRRQLELERHLARIDGLSGTLNRRAFQERLEYALAMAARNGQPLTLAYLDLDNFKLINDTLGHAAGDITIRQVARVLIESTRRTDIVARLGGDEFALLLPDTDRDGAAQLLQETRVSLLSASPHADFPIRCSIGAVTFSGKLPTCDQAIGAADALMYEVKSAGKDAIESRVQGESSSG